MANRLRILHDNAIDRATLTASSASIPISNLDLADKSYVWRTNVGVLAASINCAFSSAEQVSCVSIPFGNFTANATARIRYTQEPTGTNLLPYLSGQMENWGSAPASTRYVQAPDGTFTAVVPNPDSSFDRWEISIPANTYPNGTVLVLSYHQKTVTPVGGSGQLITPTSWVGATQGSINNIAAANGFTRKWMTVTITTTASIQILRVYTQTVGADDQAVWGWQLEVGSTPTSYYPTLATFASRASVATYLDVNGKIASAASGVARMHYQYPSLSTVPARLLVEAAATNELFYSEQFDNAAWGKGVATVTANAAGAPDAPDGTRTMDKLVASVSAVTGHYVLQSKGSFVSGDRVTTSIFAAKAEYGMICIGIFTGGAFATTHYVTFDLTTGAVVGTVGSPTFTSATQYINGVWRLSVTAVATASGTASSIAIIADTTGAGVNKYDIAGDGVSGIYIWGGMLEKGSVPTSYIVTTSAAVTRVADNYSITSGVRPAGYMDWWQSYDFDSGVVNFNTSEAIKVPTLTSTQALSAYGYGGGRAMTLYSTSLPAINVRIDLVDSQNPHGYLEAANLVVGDYFSPTYGAEIGATISMEDLSKSYRSDSGNLKKDVSAKYKKINLDLGVVTEANRTPLWKIVSYAGTSNPVWMSVYPSDTNPDKEQAYTIYGYFTKATEVAAKSYNVYSTKFEIEGL